MQSTKQVIFQLGDVQFGFDIMNVITIEKGISVEPVPNSSKSIQGIISIRGDIIPVYNLRYKFGLADSARDENTRFIITTNNGTMIAYEVDKIIKIVQIEPEQQKEVPSIIESKDTSYYNSVVNLDGKLIYLLNNEGILSEEEQDKVKNALNAAVKE